MHREQQPHTRRLNTARCIAIAALAACGGGAAGPPNNPPNTPPPTNNTTAAIVVAPTVLNLLLGGSGSLGATAYNSAGATVSGVTVAWASASPGVATVTTAGLVTGVGVGTTAVTATAGGVQGSAIVNVTNPANPLTLQIVPPIGSTTVGGSVPFTVIARDAAGVIVATPPVAWTSSAPAVASISANGTAVGLSVGTTQIQATASSLIATPATLTVNAAVGALCSDIANQARWMVQLGWDWSSVGTNSENHKVETVHSGLINGGPMSRDNLDPEFLVWSSDSGFWGSGSLSDNDTDLNGPTQTTRRFRANGPFTTTLLGERSAGVQLHVDLTTCSYRFELTALLRMTLTESDGTAESADLIFGTLRSAWIPLHPNWRQVHLKEIVSASFPVHSIAWQFGGQEFQNVYIPYGFGQLLFVGRAGANEAPEGHATVTAAFTPVP